MTFRANSIQPPSSRTPLAPLQSCARFCLEPETFPVFLAWLKRVHTGQPAEWFDEQLIRRDIEKGHDMVGTIEDLSR